MKRPGTNQIGSQDIEITIEFKYIFMKSIQTQLDWNCSDYIPTHVLKATVKALLNQCGRRNFFPQLIVILREISQISIDTAKFLNLAPVITVIVKHTITDDSESYISQQVRCLKFNRFQVLVKCRYSLSLNYKFNSLPS